MTTPGLQEYTPFQPASPEGVVVQGDTRLAAPGHIYSTGPGHVEYVLGCPEKGQLGITDYDIAAARHRYPSVQKADAAVVQ
jgi:hypothetical protein